MGCPGVPSGSILIINGIIRETSQFCHSYQNTKLPMAIFPFPSYSYR